MMKNLLFLLLCGFCSYGQKLHHQMQSSQGNSVKLSNGIHVSQTVGQQSVIGNYKKNGLVVQQGYQQANWSKYTSANVIHNIATTVYPNPFVDTINFQFSVEIQSPISVLIYDIAGRIVLEQQKLPTGNVLTLDLPHLSQAQYLVRLSGPHYLFYTKIIKRQ